MGIFNKVDILGELGAVLGSGTAGELFLVLLTGGQGAEVEHVLFELLGCFGAHWLDYVLLDLS